MNDSALSLLKLRILVLTLGEAHHAGWWRSQFLSPTGLSFLERVYPRSTFAAAVRSAGRAARAVHDANVGKGAVFHLFRLTSEMEREIDSMLAEQSEELTARYRPLLTDRAALLDELATLAGDTSTQPAVGPVRVLESAGKWAPALAAVYLPAFRAGTPAFPYLEETSAT